MLHNTLTPGVSNKSQPHYQSVLYRIFYSVLVAYKNWNIMKIANKGIVIEKFYDICKVVLDIISDNMLLVVKTVNFGNISTKDTTNMDYYIIKFLSHPVTL